jgi:putative NADH-flavin reductase
MRIILFGATGGTGREIIKQGLEEGHIITAFVRTPASLNIQNPKLRVTKGDVLEAKKVEEAICGQDVVISVLGNKTRKSFWKVETNISEGLRNILGGMKKNNIHRLIFVTSFGVSKNIFFPEKLFIRFFLKNIFADIPTQEKLISESDTTWTIIRPARLIDGPRAEKYRRGENLYIHPFSKISRADVAHFILEDLKTNNWQNKIVTISY